MNSIKKQLAKISPPSWLPPWFSPPIALISSVAALLASFLVHGSVKADVVYEGGEAPFDGPENIVDPIPPLDDHSSVPWTDPPVVSDPLPPLVNPWSMPMLQPEQAGDALPDGNGIPGEYECGSDLNGNEVTAEIVTNPDMFYSGYPGGGADSGYGCPLPNDPLPGGSDYWPLPNVPLPDGSVYITPDEYGYGAELDNTGVPDEIGINPDSLQPDYPGGDLSWFTQLPDEGSAYWPDYPGGYPDSNGAGDVHVILSSDPSTFGSSAGHLEESLSYTSSIEVHVEAHYPDDIYTDLF